MKNYLILFILVLLNSKAFSQGTNLQKATAWTLYDIKGKKTWQVPLDSLGLYPHRALNNDSMQFFLARTSAIPLDKAPVWMGAYAATCVLDNRKRKIDISVYAGFFYDELQKTYYQVPSDIQQEWLTYLSDFAASIQSSY